MIALRVCGMAFGLAFLFAAWCLFRVVNARSSRPAPPAFARFLGTTLVAQLLVVVLTGLGNDSALMATLPGAGVFWWAFVGVSYVAHRALIAYVFWTLLSVTQEVSRDGNHIATGWIRTARAMIVAFLTVMEAIIALRIGVGSGAVSPWLSRAEWIGAWIVGPGWIALWVALTWRLARVGRGEGVPWVLKAECVAALCCWPIITIAEYVLAFTGSSFPVDWVFCVALGGAVCRLAFSELRESRTAGLRASSSANDIDFSDCRLSPREREIADLLVRGYVNKEIAVQLDLSYGTVKNHISSLYAKLGISSRFELFKSRKSD